MPSINLDKKIFKPLNNSEHGVVTESTIFYYTQKNKIVSATYQGGGVLEGQILATWRSPDQLEMRYHCVMNDHTIKAGKAMAQVSKNKKGLVEMHLDWQWLGTNSEKGNSAYIEITES